MNKLDIEFSNGRLLSCGHVLCTDISGKLHQPEIDGKDEVGEYFVTITKAGQPSTEPCADKLSEGELILEAPGVFNVVVAYGSGKFSYRCIERPIIYSQKPTWKQVADDCRRIADQLRAMAELTQQAANEAGEDGLASLLALETMETIPSYIGPILEDIKALVNRPKQR